MCTPEKKNPLKLVIVVAKQSTNLADQPKKFTLENFLQEYFKKFTLGNFWQKYLSHHLQVVNASVNLPIFFFAGKTFREVTINLLR